MVLRFAERFFEICKTFRFSCIDFRISFVCIVEGLGMSLTPDVAVEGILAGRSKLLAFIWSLMRDHHVTEDIFQEVILLAMKHAAEIKDKDHLMAWARRTARFRGIDYLRRNSLAPLLLSGDVLDQLESCWMKFDGTPDCDRMDALQRCISQLTDQSQKIISMRYSQGMSCKAIAEARNRTVQAVYVALVRIYRTLEQCVHRRLLGEGR
jgi:RNA polymerase sigma-70 factor (ECF subfamily)